jgi:hypothetical protein
MWGDHDLLWGGLGHQTDSKARTQIYMYGMCHISQQSLKMTKFVKI